MECTIEITSTGELFEIEYDNEQIFINGNELDIVSIPAESDFSHAFAADKAQRERAYSIQTFPYLNDTPYEVLEIIYQIVNRMAEERLVPKKVQIDLNERFFTTGKAKKYFPHEDDLSNWDARVALKDLIYS